MIAVDTNILIYAHREDSPHHERARTALEDLIRSGRRFGIPWPCAHEFLAVTTHPRIFDPPSPQQLALLAIREICELPTATMLAETSDHLERLTQALESSQVHGPKVHDARIAMICLSHGVAELWTADRDFSYFPTLATRNPLARE